MRSIPLKYQNAAVIEEGDGGKAAWRQMQAAVACVTGTGLVIAGLNILQATVLLKRCAGASYDPWVCY